MTDLGMRKQFNEQLEKMNHQDKHQYKDSREKWSYARNKILNKKEENLKKS